MTEELHLSGVARRCLPPPPAHHTYSLAVTQNTPSWHWGGGSDKRWREKNEKKKTQERRWEEGKKTDREMFKVGSCYQQDDERRTDPVVWAFLLMKPEVPGETGTVGVVEWIYTDLKQLHGLHWWTNHITLTLPRHKVSQHRPFLWELGGILGCFPLRSPI